MQRDLFYSAPVVLRISPEERAERKRKFADRLCKLGEKAKAAKREPVARGE